MATFNHAVLFTKEDCAPCLNTKGYIHENVPDDLKHHLSIFQKENHTALVTAYNLELYPTLLIVDEGGRELDRIVGGKKVQACINQFLTEIDNARRV